MSSTYAKGTEVSIDRTTRGGTVTPNKRATLEAAALLLIFLVIFGTGIAMIVYSMTQPPLPGVPG